MGEWKSHGVNHDLKESKRLKCKSALESHNCGKITQTKTIKAYTITANLKEIKKQDNWLQKLYLTKRRSHVVNGTENLK